MFMPRDTSNLSLEEKVQLLMDKDAIRDVIYRDQRAKGRGDKELMKSCFFEDAIDYHQPYFIMNAHDIADMLDPKAMGEMVQYVAQQVLIDIDGDVARVESYIVSSKIMHERSAAGHHWLRSGGIRLLDRFERRNGEWRIAKRQLVPEWGVFHEVPPLTEAIGYVGAGTDVSGLVPANDAPGGEARDNSMKAVKHAADRTDPSYHI